MALTEAGFKTMAGTSPFALVNLGAGAQAGLQSYGAAQDKMAALEEKRYALMNEAAKADRAEKQAAIMFGENSYQHKAAMDQRERLGQAELNLRKYTADVSTKNAMIAAAKKSDFESFLSLAKEDEDNYKTVKDKDGNVKKIFDVNKATQTYKAYGPSGSTDKEFLEQYERQSMLDKDFKKKFPTAADYVLDQRARLSGANAPAASSTSSGFSNFRISK
jgi:hypothetical protein